MRESRVRPHDEHRERDDEQGPIQHDGRLRLLQESAVHQDGDDDADWRSEGKKERWSVDWERGNEKGGGEDALRKAEKAGERDASRTKKERKSAQLAHKRMPVDESRDIVSTHIQGKPSPSRNPESRSPQSHRTRPNRSSQSRFRTSSIPSQEGSRPFHR